MNLRDLASGHGAANVQDEENRLVADTHVFRSDEVNEISVHHLQGTLKLIYTERKRTRRQFFAGSFRVSLFIDLGAHEIRGQSGGEPSALFNKVVIGENLAFEIG